MANSSPAKLELSVLPKCRTAAIYGSYIESAPAFGAKPYTKKLQGIIGPLDVPHRLAPRRLVHQVSKRCIHQPITLQLIKFPTEVE